jgi:hypothetical protein
MPASTNVDKAAFLAAIKCPTQGWFVRKYRHASSPTEADQLRMEEGMEIGRRARGLFPGGRLVPPQTTSAAVELTRKLMADPKGSSIFEGTFAVDGYVAKADILQRRSKGWHLLEVKSRLEPDAELVQDVTYTLMVLRRAGVNVVRVSLVLLSRNFRLGMTESKMFEPHDCTADAVELLDEFDECWDSAKSAVLAAKRRTPELIFACKGCAFFSTHCLGKGIEAHIFQLPRLSTRMFDKLVKTGASTIHDIPGGFPLTEPQERARRATVIGRPQVSSKPLKQYLAQITWPAFYLDFETVKSAIPLYPNIKPHEQIPTQYSLHICDRPGRVIDHREFLASPSRDERRELAENLLKDLNGLGHIVVYTSFEKTTLKKLGDLFGDLKPALDGCVARLFDLEKVFRSWYCHPSFHGKTSIKVTLPALVDMSYKGLAIADGDAAVAKFARMARGEISGKEAIDVRRALLEYCKQDTLAMVRLHKHLADL